MANSRELTETDDPPDSNRLLFLSREFFKRHVTNVTNDSTSCSSPASTSGISSAGFQSSASFLSSLGSLGSDSSSGCGDLRDRLSSNGATIFLGSRVFIRPTETAVGGLSAMTLEEAFEHLQLPMLDTSHDELGGLKQWADQVSLWRMICESLMKEMDSRLSHLEESKAKYEANGVTLKVEFRHEEDKMHLIVSHRSEITKRVSTVKCIMEKLQHQFDSLAKGLHLLKTDEYKQLRALMHHCKDTGPKFFNATLTDRIKKSEQALLSMGRLLAARRQDPQLNHQMAARIRQLKDQLAIRQSDLHNAKQLQDKFKSELPARSTEPGPTSGLDNVVAKLPSPKELIQKKQQENQRRQLQLQRQKEQMRRRKQLKLDKLMLDEKLQQLLMQKLRLSVGMTADRPPAAGAQARTKSALLVEKRRRACVLQRKLKTHLERADRLSKVARFRARVERAEAAALSVARARRQLAKRRQLQAETRRIDGIVDRLVGSCGGRAELQRLFAQLRSRLDGALKRLQLRPLRHVKDSTSKAGGTAVSKKLADK